MSDPPDDMVVAFVEEASVVFEEMGVPPIAGRIWAYLLVCEPPHQSAEQLAEALDVSRGSISSMTRLLMQTDLVERTAVAGDRRKYYRLNSGGWSSIFARRLDQVERLIDTATYGLELLEDEPAERRERLQEMRKFYRFINEEMPKLLQRWEKWRAGLSRDEGTHRKRRDSND